MAEPRVIYGILTISEAQSLPDNQLADINNLLSQFGAEEIKIDQRYLAEIAQNSRVVLAITSDIDRQSILGIACLVPLITITGRSGWISHIVVDKTKRRHGIATRMHSCIIHEARRLSLRRLDLTSRESRVEGQKFWKKQGYTQRETNNFRLELT